ncbi:MAG TPA: S9 family peptidase [Thermoanaerobaculia bacterium]|jgi:dipeptidyl aminopeptidase/acylaminoacyl peptidase|nr:S9 family peptidase [Thermoanaerobaculia bacterium]
MRRIAFALLFITALFAPFTYGQQQRDDAMLDDLDRVRTFNAVAISPDGHHVAWSVQGIGVTTATTAGMDVHLLPGDGDDHYVAWSPDSQMLATVSDGGKEQRQIFVTHVGGTPVRVTNVRGYLAEPQWSPDGKSIAFLFIENAARAAGPLVAMSRAVGPIEEHIDEQRVAIVDVATKKVRIVTPADMYVYHFGWSPDGKQLVAEAAPGSGDNNYWIAKLHVVDVAAAAMRPIYTPQLQLAEPRWSPDGKSIAFIEGLMSDEGSTGGDLFVIPAAGGAARNLTPDLKASVTSFAWTGADRITFGEDVAGESAIVRVDTTNGTMETVWRGEELVTSHDLIGASLANDGVTSAVIRSSFKSAPDVWAGRIGDWKRVSTTNASIRATWGDARSIRWKSDAFDVQGWLLAPAQMDAARKYPLIVWIHGGPASASLAKWPDNRAALLSRRGYFVFFPNPRGSYGQGEAFTRANVKDFGYGDLRDVMSGIDAAAASNPIDTARLGIWGWSYGGYMTMWTVTQTTRFKAAVAGAGIANWQSYYGENDIDAWMIPYFGASVYDDPAVYARSAPITFVKNIKTPTLVVVGERDGECPAPQSFEFWHALKTLGVETQLVVYPDEGHRIAKKEHQRDIARRLVGWFDSHLR